MARFCREMAILMEVSSPWDCMEPLGDISDTLLSADLLPWLLVCPTAPWKSSRRMKGSSLKDYGVGDEKTSLPQTVCTWVCREAHSLQCALHGGPHCPTALPPREAESCPQGELRGTLMVTFALLVGKFMVGQAKPPLLKILHPKSFPSLCPLNHESVRRAQVWQGILGLEVEALHPSFETCNSAARTANTAPSFLPSGTLLPFFKQNGLLYAPGVSSARG